MPTERMSMRPTSFPGRAGDQLRDAATGNQFGTPVRGSRQRADVSAAAAWDELAAELGTAAAGYGSVISEMTTTPWIGPSSVAMVAAVIPYVGWLDTVATLAEQTAGQARAAAAAYEAAHAMTVPPPVILANRVLLTTLIATNFFGQNSAAIAATEAQYMEMWAQDATAMYEYVASSATAAQLHPFTSPPDTTKANQAASQATAAAQATATQAGNTSQTTTATTSQLASTTTASQMLQQLSSATSLGVNSSSSGGLSWLPSPANNWLGLVPANYKTIFHDLLQEYLTLGLGNSGWSIGQQLTFGQGTTAGAGGAWYPTPEFGQLGLGGHGSSAAASTGQAVRIGRLSVPHNWHALTAEENPEELEELEEIEELEESRWGWPLTAAGHSVTPLTHDAAAHAAAGAAGGNEVLGGVPTRFSGRSTGGYIHKYGWRYSGRWRPPAGRLTSTVFAPRNFIERNIYVGTSERCRRK